MPPTPEEVPQLGGDFVVDPGGTVSFAHRIRNNGDRASVDRLMEVLGEAVGVG